MYRLLAALTLTALSATLARALETQTYIEFGVHSTPPADTDFEMRKVWRVGRRIVRIDKIGEDGANTVEMINNAGGEPHAYLLRTSAPPIPLEIGREIQFFEERAAVRSADETQAGFGVEVYKLDIELHKLTLYVDRVTRNPREITVRSPLGNYSIKYAQYVPAAPFTGDWFRPADGGGATIPDPLNAHIPDKEGTQSYIEYGLTSDPPVRSDYKVRQLWRAGRHYLRFQYPQDESGSSTIKIANGLDLYTTTTRPEKTEHTRTDDSDGKPHAYILARGGPKTLVALEFGNEVEFFKDHHAARSSDEIRHGRRNAVYTLSVETCLLTLHIDLASGDPIELTVKSTRESFSIRYAKYQHGAPFEPLRFQPPPKSEARNNVRSQKGPQERSNDERARHDGPNKTIPPKSNATREDTPPEEDAVDKQTYIEFQYLQPSSNASPQFMPDGKLRKMWRSGSRRMRLEEPPDPQTGMIGVTIVDEPHIFVIFEKAGLAQHALDPGPTYVVHAPAFPGPPNAEITKLELGEEIGFFRTHNAKRGQDVTIGGIRRAVFNLLIGEDALTLHVDPKRRVPLQLAVNGPKRSGTVRYVKYNKEQYDAARYTVPPGLRVIEIANQYNGAADLDHDIRFKVDLFNKPGGATDSSECLRRPIVLYFFKPGDNQDIDAAIIEMQSHFKGGQLCFFAVAHGASQDSRRVVEEGKFSFPIVQTSYPFPNFLMPSRFPAAVLIDRDRHFEKYSVRTPKDQEEVLRKTGLMVDDESPDSTIALDDLDAHRRSDIEPGLDTFIKKIHNDRVGGKYKDLDRLAEELRSRRDRWSNGAWKLETFYETVTSINERTEKDYLDTIKILESWIKSSPQSPTPRIALGRLMISYAFLGRGGGWAQDMTPVQTQRFEERLVKAERILEDARPLEPKCPDLYRQLVTVGWNKGWPRKKIDSVYAEGSLIEPEYQYLYSTMAHYLLPKWGGAPGEWEAFAKRVAESTGRNELYTRIVLLNMDELEFGHINEKLFSNSKIEWALMKKGFVEQQERYPKSMRNSNYFAWFATLAKDKEAAKSAFLRIGEEYSAEIWGNNINFEHWRRWANSKKSVQKNIQRHKVIIENADQDMGKETAPLSY